MEGYAKHAWLIFFVFGIGSVIAGIIIVTGVVAVDPPSAESTTGLTMDQIAARVPGIEAYVTGLARQLGNFMVGMGIVLAGVAAIPFRRGERWAWYACWSLAIVVMVQLTNSFAIYGFAHGGFGWQLDVASLVLVLAGLLLPYRRFFPQERG
ncbi:MAG: hypothetical protein H0W81_01165 [Chloroflexi bacterium]|nr:hypothetical protein [Chloroflexota bacterium]